MATSDWPVWAFAAMFLLQLIWSGWTIAPLFDAHSSFLPPNPFAAHTMAPAPAIPRANNGARKTPVQQCLSLTLSEPVELISIAAIAPTALKELGRLRNENDRLRAKAGQTHSLQVQNRRLRGELDTSKSTASSLRSQVNGLQENVFTLDARLVDANRLRDRLRTARASQQIAEEDAKEAKADRDEAKGMLKSADETFRSRIYNNESYRNQISRLEAEVDRAWKAATTADKQVISLREAQHTSKQVIKNAEQKLSDTKRILEHVEAEVQALRSRPQTRISTANGRQLDEMRGKLAAAEQGEQKKTARITELERKVSDLGAEVKRLGKKPVPSRVHVSPPRPAAPPPELTKQQLEQIQKDVEICQVTPTHKWHGGGECPWCNPPEEDEEL